jgi:hypothetical protein
MVGENLFGDLEVTVVDASQGVFVIRKKRHDLNTKTGT